MLCITYVADCPMKDLTWHVGDSFSPSDVLEHSALVILSVYADGHELDHVLATFENLPRVKKITRAQVWRGDFARFIFDNL